jgi:rubrerythrin
MAMGIEQSGEAFYRAVAGKALSAEMRALFTDLAEQEVKHYQVFAKFAQSVRNQPLMLAEEWDEYQGYLEATVQSALFEGPDKALTAAEGVKDEREAVGMAMGFEKETMLFFHDLRDMVPERDHELIERIIAEERRHLRRLAGML